MLVTALHLDSTIGPTRMLLIWGSYTGVFIMRTAGQGERRRCTQNIRFYSICRGLLGQILTMTLTNKMNYMSQNLYRGFVGNLYQIKIFFWGVIKLKSNHILFVVYIFYIFFDSNRWSKVDPKYHRPNKPAE